MLLNVENLKMAFAHLLLYRGSSTPVLQASIRGFGGAMDDRPMNWLESVWFRRDSTTRHLTLCEKLVATRVRHLFLRESKAPVVGEYGLAGGGAAGLELDATNHALGTPPHTLVLASSERHSDLYLMTPEDMNDPAPGLGGTEAEIIRAEMVFFETPSGGAVFSTGSIAWSASLSHADYKNDVARITANVLKRFLDETPFAPAAEH